MPGGTLPEPRAAGPRRREEASGVWSHLLAASGTYWTEFCGLLACGSRQQGSRLLPLVRDTLAPGGAPGRREEARSAARKAAPPPAGVCSGWGDPHYITFDGVYYTFLDNCTYVLVQQIVPVFGHFRVLIDNYFCDAEDRLSCPQSIIVEYQQDRVVLTRKPVRGVMTNEVGTPAGQPPFVPGGLGAPGTG